jgi:hypothetical protein
MLRFGLCADAYFAWNSSTGGGDGPIIMSSVSGADFHKSIASHFLVLPFTADPNLLISHCLLRALFKFTFASKRAEFWHWVLKAACAALPIQTEVLWENSLTELLGFPAWNTDDLFRLVRRSFSRCQLRVGLICCATLKNLPVRVPGTPQVLLAE